MAQTFKTSIVVDGNVNATGFYGDGSNLTGITPTGALLLTGGNMTGPLTITTGGIALTLTSSQNTGLVVDGGTNSGVIADFKFGTRKAYISTSGNIYVSGLFDIDDTNYYVNPAGFSNVSGLNVASSEVAIALTGTQSRISFKDQDNVWTGYVGFSGNVGSLDFPGRNVRITAGYNGTIELNTGASGYNSGRIHVPYGYLSVDNAGVYATAFYDSNDSGYYVDPASTSNLNALNVGGQAVITAGNIGSQSVNYATSAGNANTLDGIDSSAFVQKYNVYSGGNHNMDVWNNVHAAYSDNSNTSSWIVVQTSVPQDSYSMGGFELVFEEDYEAASEGGTLKIYGYWNPETNGGFVGFKYTTDNPLLNPNIYVARNTTSGNTAFLIQGGNTSYAQIIARNLWLGYSASGATTTWGDGWSISEQADQSGFTNIDQLINASRSYFQPASTAITTSNIGSQSVNYASSAGTATDLNAADSTQINFNNVTNTDYSTMTFTSRAWQDVQGVNGLAYTFNTHTNAGNGGYGALQIYYGESGYVYAPTSFRAPIFYDSDNTGYFLNPDATSVSLKIKGGIVTDAPSGSVLLEHQVPEANAWIFKENAANWGLYWFNAGSNSGQGIGSYTTVGAELFGMNNAVTGFNPPETWAGINTDARAAWMLSNYSGYFWSQGTQYSETDMRAPVFYDSNNTGYYLDPHATSNLNTLQVSTIRNNGSVADDDAFGIYWTDSADNGYAIYREPGSWSHPYPDLRIAFHTGIKLGANSSYNGIRFYTDYDMATQVMSVNNSSDGYGAGHVHVNGIMNAGDSHRAPIFYDSNDTGYYTDPSSVSRVNIVTPNYLRRATHETGHLEGGYNNIGGSDNYSNPIFTIGYNYNPSSTSLANMYGIGYTNQSASFINFTGASDWGMYVAAGGAARIWLGGNSGNISNVGATYTPIIYDYNNTGYYVDPNGMSSVYGIAIRGDNSSTDTSNQIFFWSNGNSTTSAIGFKANGGYFPNPTGSGDGYNTYLTMDTPGRGWVFREGVGGSDFGAAYTSGWILNNGIWQANASMRAPIFYDSNNTGYYVNPDSTSRLNSIVYDNLYWTGDQSYGFIGRNVYADTINGRGGDPLELNYYDGGAVKIGSGVYGSKELYAGALYDAGSRVAISRGEGRNYIDYSRYVYNNNAYSGSGWVEPSDLGVRYANSSNYANYLQTAYVGGQQLNPQVYFNNGVGLKAAMTGAWGYWSDTLWINGYAGGDVLQMCALHTQRNGQPRIAISAQASNGSSYGTLYEIWSSYNMDAPNKSGTSYYQVNTWMQFNGFYGLYWPNQYGAHFYPNDASTYTHFRLSGSKNGYGGIYDSYSAVAGIMYDSAGNGGVYREASGRWYFYHHVGNNCTGINTSTTSSAYGLYVDKGIYSTGDITAYSDVRKKTNIATIDSALDKVTRLRGVYYDRIDDLERGRQIGVIAQEVNEVLPEAVTYAEDIDEYGVKYGNIVGVLIEAIKDQQKQIEELKAIVDGLTK